MKRVLPVLFALAALAATSSGTNGGGVSEVSDTGAKTKPIDGAASGLVSGLENPETVKVILAIVCALVAVIFLAFVVWFLVSKLTNKESNMDIGDGIGSIPDSGLEKRLTKHIDELANRMDDFGEKLTRLINMLSSGSFSQRTNVGAAVPPLSMPPTPPLPVMERPKEVFYFANPFGPEFKVGKASQSPDTALYRFERFVGEGKAQVFVIDEPRVVTRFTAKPEAQDGVCDDGGNFKPDAKKIEVSPGCEGIAVLDGDSWRVIQKVKIKYI